MTKSNMNLLAQAIITALMPFTNSEEGINEAVDKAIEGIESVDTETGEITTPDGPWALTSCKEFFIPWNKEIHSGPKTISKPGTFARRKNIEDDFFTTTENAWLDLHGLEAALYEIDENNENKIPQLIVVEEHEEEQLADEKPAKKAPPAKKSPPSKPGKKAPPAKKSNNEASALRKEAIININCLTKDYGVGYDLVIETILTPLGVESFDDLPEENYKEVHRDVKAWLSWFNLINEYKSKFEAFDAKHGDDLCDEYTGLTEGLNLSSFGQMSPIYDEVKELHDQWAEYYS